MHSCARSCYPMHFVSHHSLAVTERPCNIPRSVTQVSITWAASGIPSDEFSFVTSIRAYSAVPVIIFEQSYPMGATQHGDRGGAASAFPSWALDAPAGSPTLAYFAGHGQASSSGASWADAAVGGGHQGAAVVALFPASQPLYDGNNNASSAPRCVVTSPFGNFMASSFDIPSKLLDGRGAPKFSASGVLGSVTTIPAGFSHSTVLVGGRGVASTLMDWGDVLLLKGGKHRTVLDHPTDVSLTHIGYWTVSQRIIDPFSLICS